MRAKSNKTLNTRAAQAGTIPHGAFGMMPYGIIAR